MLLEVTAPAPAAASEFDEENARGNNGGNNGAVAGWRWPTRDLRKCLKRQRPALVVAGRRRLRSRRSWVRIPPGAWTYKRDNTFRPNGPKVSSGRAQFRTGVDTRSQCIPA